MTDSPLGNLHPNHLLYVMLSPIRDENDLNIVFERLEQFETKDLKWMIGFVRAAIGVDWAGDGDEDDDEQCKKNLLRFRNRCAELINSGVENFFLTYAIVTFVCNYLRQQGDLSCTMQSNRWLSGAAKYFQERADAGEIPQDMADQQRRMVEERINNSTADTELMKERYDLFCEKVVGALLPNLPTT